MSYCGVSAVFQQGEVLEVWLQKDAELVQNLDRLVHERVLSQPQQYIVPKDPNLLLPNMYCYALFSDSKFHRVTVMATVANLLHVQDIDHGFKFATDYRNVRFPVGEDLLSGIPPGAERFVVAKVLLTGKLSAEEMQCIERSLLFSRVIFSVLAVNVATKTKLATIMGADGVDVKEHWRLLEKVREVPLHVQDSRLTAVYQERMVPTAVTYPQTPLSGTHPFLPVAELFPKIASPHPVPTHVGHSPPLASHVDAGISCRQFAPPPPVLRMDTSYKVLVTDYAGGPWNFSVQLQDDQPLLEGVTEALQRVEKVPIRAPHYTGKHCIAFHPIQKVYARATIANEGDRSATVDFIDFGDTEVISLRELFELPPQGLKTHHLSQKFRLSALPAIKPDSSEYKDLIINFRDAIRNKQLLLTVTPTEEGCAQNCDLYDRPSGKNVKTLMNEKEKKKKLFFVADKLPAVSTTLPVYISHVDSLLSFYVQKVERENECTELIDALQEAGKVAEPMEEVKPNYPCLVKFSTDDLWYRARVTQECTSERATVFFVDYGNTEIVALNQLMELPRRLVKPPTLAIASVLQCDDQFSEATRESVEEKLRSLVNEQGVIATVTGASVGPPNLLHLTVFHGGADISVPLKYSFTSKPTLDVDSWRKKEHWQTNLETRPGLREKDRERPAEHRQTLRDRFARLDLDRGGRDWGGRSDRGARGNRGGDDGYDRGEKGGHGFSRRRRNQQSAGSGRFSHEHDDRCDDPGMAQDSGSGRPSNSDGGFQSSRRDNSFKQNRRDDDQNFGGGFKHNDHDGGFRKNRRDEDSGGGFGDGGFRKNRQNEENAGGFGDGGFRKNRQNEDNGGGFGDGGFRKNRQNEDNGGGFGDGGFRKNRQNEDNGGGFGDGGFRKNRQNEDNGGGFGDGGFRKNRQNEDNGGGFGDGGFRKNRRDDASGGGFNKFGGGDSGRPDRPMRQPIRNEDRAPAGSEWAEPSIDLNVEEDVLITYFVTPHDFYVHTTTDRDAFVTMVENMQTDYANKFSHRKNEPPQVPDIVIGKFSEDKVLYRAEVTVSEPLTVRFVDYGNTDTISDGRDVYPVMSKLLDLPKQAVRCRLAGVTPIGEKWSDTSNYFDKEQIKCTFLSVEDGIYTVSLSCNGEDIAQQLIAGGAATGGVSVVAQTVAVLPGDSGVAHISSSLLVGDVGSLTVSYVEGVDKFYVQPDLSSVTRMEALVVEHLRMSSKPLDVDGTEDVAGKWCIGGLTPETRYRAQIVEFTPTGAWLQFVDYGDGADVPFSEILEISENLKSYPALAIECGLRGDTSQVTDEAQDTFKEAYEGKSTLVYIHSIEDSRLLVTVYDELGVKAVVDGWVSDSPASAPLPQQLLPSSEMTVQVLDMTGPNSCLVTVAVGQEPDLSAVEQLTDATSQVEEGSVCAAKCSDGVWRRTIRPSTADNDAHSFLVDVGRTELCREFRPLPAPMAVLPAIVRQVRCSLPVLGQQRIKVERDENGLSIEPVFKTVFTPHVESSSELYVYHESIASKIDEIQAELVEMQPAPLNDSDFAFAAKFPEDEQWYRARLEGPSEPLHVRFLDYGNCAEVTDVAPLPSHLASYPPLATLVHLHAGLPSTVTEELTQLLTLSEVPFLLVEEDGKVVDLLQGDLSVADKILKRRPLKVGSALYISHVESPSHFYGQPDEVTDLLEKTAEQLLKADSFAEVSEPVKGQILVAKFTEDCAWYRATVTGSEVWFMDHGNTAELSEVREMPDDLREVLPMAVRLSLRHPSGGEWTPEATDALYEFLDGRKLIVKQASWVDNAYVVSLVDSEGGDIAHMLGGEPADNEPLDNNAGGGTQQPEAANSTQEWQDGPTDDHKSGSLALRNETDEEKRNKMSESPRSDDEKIVPTGSESASAAVNVPDCELVTDILNDIVTIALDSSEPREANSDSFEDAETGETLEESEDNAEEVEDRASRDPETGCSDVNDIANHVEVVCDITAEEPEIENMIKIESLNESSLTEDIDTSVSDHDSGLASHPAADLSRSLEGENIGENVSDASVCSSASAATGMLPDSADARDAQESLLLTGVEPSINGTSEPITLQANTDCCEPQKVPSCKPGRSLADKIVPGAINRGIEMPNGESTHEQ